MNRRSRSLTQTLFTHQVLLLLFTLAVIGPMIYLVLLNDLQGRAKQSNQVLTRAVSAQVVEFINTPTLLLKALDAGGYVAGYQSSGSFRGLMDRLIDQTQAFEAIYFLATDNLVEAVGLPEERRRFRRDYEDVYLGAQAFVDKARVTGRPQWSDIFLSVLSNTSLGIAVPLADKAVLVGHFSIEKLSYFVQTLSLGSDTLAFIVDGHGQVIVFPDTSLAQQQLNISNLPLISAALQSQESTGDLVLFNRDFLASSFQIPGMDWVVVVAQPKASIARGIEKTLWVVLIGICAALGVALLFSRWFAVKLAQPFELLTQATEQLQQGNFDLSMPTSKVREIQSMSHRFERMARELEAEQCSLQASERKYRALLHTVPSPIFYKNENGDYLGCNRAFERFFEISLDDLLGSHADADKRLPQCLRRLAEGEAQLLGQVTAETEDLYLQVLDQTRFITLKRASFTDDQGHVAGMVGVIYDLTDRVEAERESQRLRRYMNNVLDSMPSVLFCISPQLELVQVNPEGVKKIEDTGVDNPGYQDVLAQYGLGKDWLKAAITGGQTVTRRRQLSADSSRHADITLYLLDRSVGGGIVLRIDDVTERMYMEEMLAQSEKILSVGGLAAGMAHEINNPLAGILQNIQVVKNRLDPEFGVNQRAAERCDLSLEAVRHYLEERSIPQMLDAVEASGQRAARIVDNMLSFARTGGAGLLPVDLETLLERTIELTFNDYGLKKTYDFRKIELIREFVPVKPVRGESSKLQQVFFNLLKNSAQALREAQSPHPQITLRLRSLGDCARIEVEDNGPGMTPEVIKRVFEPFFTTKEEGVGTGLGLSVSYFIITENHQGKLWVESGVGRGATFVIELPFV